MSTATISPLGAHASGRPAVPPVSYSKAARMARKDREWEHQNPDDPAVKTRGLLDRIFEWLKIPGYGGIDDLSRQEARDPTADKVRWGIAFYEDVPQKVRDALAPLVAHRKGCVLPNWEILDRLGDWLGRQGIDELNRDPTKLPYYVLLVGRPDQISFQDQYELGRIRAVGRLDLGDDPAAYQAYAESVCAFEPNPPVARRALLAAARTVGDPATALSAEHLVPALVELLASDTLKPLGYQGTHLDAARRDELAAALGPDAQGRAPALSFLATHGVSFDSGQQGQEDDQGGWISSDWTGGDVDRDTYLAAEDVGKRFYTPGSIVFSLACFGAGTSQRSEYARYYNLLQPQDPLEEVMAKRPFIAGLPRRLLAHRQGGKPAGALAFVGHVDLSWSASFWDDDKKLARPAFFESFVERILQGETVGMAADCFAKAVDIYNSQLSNAVTMDNFGGVTVTNKKKAAATWIGRNNFQGFIVLGDPAVRIDPEKVG